MLQYKIHKRNRFWFKCCVTCLLDLPKEIKFFYVQKFKQNVLQ